MSDTNIVSIDDSFRLEKSTQTASRTNNDLLQLIYLTYVEIGMLEKRDSHAMSLPAIRQLPLYDRGKGSPNTVQRHVGQRQLVVILVPAAVVVVIVVVAIHPT